MEEIYCISRFGLFSIPSNLNEDSSEGRLIEVSDEERQILKNICLKFINRPINIMEIGVYRNGNNSFTKVLIDNKHPNSKYFGVDLEDKSFLNADNIYTFKNTSFEFDKVVVELNKVGIFFLDILFIDGDHSMKATLSDWSYSVLMNKGGHVLIHDVHTHSGPKKLMEIIDRNLFDVKFLTDDKVYGLGLAIRK